MRTLVLCFLAVSTLSFADSEVTSVGRRPLPRPDDEGARRQVIVCCAKFEYPGVCCPTQKGVVVNDSDAQDRCDLQGPDLQPVLCK